MSTATQAPSKIQGEERFVIPQVDWEGYLKIYELCDRKGIRVTYDRGRLELMSPSNAHEQLGWNLAILFILVCEELEIPCPAGGSTTFRSEAEQKAIEPDACFFLKNLDRLKRAKREPWNDLTDPSPDLAIEIEITSSALDRLGIYAALGVGEVWRLDGGTLTAHRFLADGTTKTESRSSLFPWLPFEEVVSRVMDYEPSEDLIWKRSIRQWARDELALRRDALRASGLSFEF